MSPCAIRFDVLLKSHTNGGSMNLKVHQYNESTNRKLKNFWHLRLYFIIMKDKGPKVFKLVKTNSALDFRQK